MKVFRRLIIGAISVIIILVFMHITGLGDGMDYFDQLIVFGAMIYIALPVLAWVLAEIVQLMGSLDNSKQTRYDREGYNCEGYNREGYNREGYDKDGYDPKGYNREGYDREGYNRDGYNREGYNCEGYNYQGYDRESFDKDGYHISGYNSLGYNRDGYDRDGHSIHVFNAKESPKNGNRIDKTRVQMVPDSECVAYLKSRNVRRLVHFTPLCNLPSILKKGIIPRSDVGSNVCAPDEFRYDSFIDCSCFSLTSPNYLVLYKKVKEMQIPFVLLSLDIDILNRFELCDVAFFYDNAAKCKYRNRFIEHTGLNAAMEMFSEPEPYYREDNSLPRNCPTDPQAEVLIRGVIPPSFISEVVVENDTTARLVSDMGLPPGIELIRRPAAFAKRQDYLYWRSTPNMSDYT